MYLGELHPGSGTGIVGLWHLNGNSNDSSGNGNNGTDTDITYSRANGKFEQGAGFNGSSSKIALPNNASLKPTSAFSIMVWIKTSSSNDQVFFGNAVINSGDYSGFVIDKYSNKLRLGIFPSNGTSTSTLISGNTSINDNIWHLVVGVYNGTNMYLYVDGISDATPVASNPPQYDTTSYPTIGANITNGSYGSFMNGSIDEAALFNRAPSASEIRKMYAVAKGRYL